MKRISLTILGWLFVLVPLQAQINSQEILEKIDSLVTFMDTDFAAEVEIVQTKPEEGQSYTKVALFRRDRDNKYLIVVLKPDSDKGKGYLRNGNNLWLYDPVARRFTVTSAKDRFQGSNARNSDFSRSALAKDYRISKTGREKLGRWDTTIYELEATRDDVTFPRSKIWVTDDNLIRKTEDYSLSGQLLRTIVIPSYQKVGTRFVPVKVSIIDALRGKQTKDGFQHEATQITFTKPTMDPVPDLVFTQTYLEKMAQ